MPETSLEATQSHCDAAPSLVPETDVSDGPNQPVLSAGAAGGRADIRGEIPPLAASSARSREYIIVLSVISYLDLPSAAPEAHSRFRFRSNQCEEQFNSDARFDGAGDPMPPLPELANTSRVLANSPEMSSAGECLAAPCIGAVNDHDERETSPAQSPRTALRSVSAKISSERPAPSGAEHLGLHRSRAGSTLLPTQGQRRSPISSAPARQAGQAGFRDASRLAKTLPKPLQDGAVPSAAERARLEPVRLSDPFSIPQVLTRPAPAFNTSGIAHHHCESNQHDEE